MALFGFGKKKEKPAPAPTPKPAPAPETPETLYQKGMTEYAIKQYAAAFPLFQKAAEQGHGKALLQCAEMYAQGKGVEKNLRQALALAEKAKSQGVPGASGAHADIAAQFVLEDGGSKKTAVKIATSVQKAVAPAPAPTPQPSKSGDDLTSEERYTKGMELFKARDYDGAFPLLERTCSFFSPRKDKYPDGQAAMGWMYENGQGTEAKDSAAYLHYKGAAKNGSRDGMAGMVRLTAKKDVPSVDECQTALEYIKQLGTEEARSLLSTVNRKLAEAQKREELKELDLTRENVQAIFNQCGKVNEDGSTTWDGEKLASNKTTILYLMGQLALVRDGVTEHELDASFFKRYDGQEWAGRIATAINLLNMGGKSGFCSFSKKDGKQFVDLVADKLKPTLSPQDPAFLEWWKKNGAEFEAEIAYDRGNEAADYPKCDYTTAFPLFEKAAKLGHPQAQYKCGVYYCHGWGVAPDRDKASMWLKKAEMQGVEEATKFLFDLSGYMGDAEAKYTLAQKYEQGIGVSVNIFVALEWYRKSEQDGSKEAKKAVERVERRLNDMIAHYDRLSPAERNLFSDYLHLLTHEQRTQYFKAKAMRHK